MAIRIRLFSKCGWRLRGKAPLHRVSGRLIATSNTEEHTDLRACIWKTVWQSAYVFLHSLQIIDFNGLIFDFTWKQTCDV